MVAWFLFLWHDVALCGSCCASMAETSLGRSRSPHHQSIRASTQRSSHLERPYIWHFTSLSLILLSYCRRLSRQLYGILLFLPFHAISVTTLGVCNAFVQHHASLPPFNTSSVLRIPLPFTLTLCIDSTQWHSTSMHKESQLGFRSIA